MGVERAHLHHEKDLSLGASFEHAGIRVGVQDFLLVSFGVHKPRSVDQYVFTAGLGVGRGDVSAGHAGVSDEWKLFCIRVADMNLPILLFPLELVFRSQKIIDEAALAAACGPQQIDRSPTEISVEVLHLPLHFLDGALEY